MDERKTVFGGTTIALIIVWIWAILDHSNILFHKGWFDLPVWLYALIVAAATVVIFWLMGLYGDDFDLEIPYSWLLVVGVGIILCITLGLLFTGPAGDSPMVLQDSQTTSANQGNSPVWILINNSDIGFSGIDCDSELCFGFYILIFLVAILSFLSATFYSFWVIASSILITILLIFCHRCFLE